MNTPVLVVADSVDKVLDFPAAALRVYCEEVIDVGASHRSRFLVSVGSEEGLVSLSSKKRSLGVLAPPSCVWGLAPRPAETINSGVGAGSVRNDRSCRCGDDDGRVRGTCKEDRCGHHSRWNPGGAWLPWP